MYCDALSFTAVGDLMLGDSAKCIGFGVRSAALSSGPSYLFEKVSSYLDGDIVFANLECVLGERDFSGWSFKKAQMRGAPNAITAVREAGFTIVNVANNHTMQHGAVGFRDTCRIVEDAGIGVVGIRGEGGYLCRPLLLEIGAKRVGILGYGCDRDNYCIGAPLYAQGTDCEIIADTAKLSAECDKVVVSLHWGHEFVSEPSGQMVSLGRKLIDAGACLVVGHHPHVLQKTETYGAGMICYSLGNFVSDMLWSDPLRRGIIVTFDLDTTTTVKKAVLVKTGDDYSVTPLEVARKYPDFPPDSPLCSDYSSNVERLRLRNRNLSHLYVLKNCHRYNPVILMQIAFQSIRSALKLSSRIDRR